jgi:hypothetical protein
MTHPRLKKKSKVKQFLQDYLIDHCKYVYKNSLAKRMDSPNAPGFWTEAAIREEAFLEDEAEALDCLDRIPWKLHGPHITVKNFRSTRGY